MAEEKQKALIELLRGHKVYLQTHNFPDPDAISSAFGLKRYLEYYGITSTICYVGSIDRFNTRKMMDTFGIEIYSYDDIPYMQAEDTNGAQEGGGGGGGLYRACRLSETECKYDRSSGQ